VFTVETVFALVGSHRFKRKKVCIRFKSFVWIARSFDKNGFFRQKVTLSIMNQNRSELLWCVLCNVYWSFPSIDPFFDFKTFFLFLSLFSSPFDVVDSRNRNLCFGWRVSDVLCFCCGLFHWHFISRILWCHVQEQSYHLFRILCRIIICP
jgi:hypothetical protein